MTVQELDNAFKLYLNKVDSMGTADFLPLERQQFLNDAQLLLARSICQKKSQDQDEVDLRRTLSTPITLNGQKAGPYNDLFVTLPDNYLHYGMLWVTEPITDTDLTTRVAPTVVNEDELLNLLNDPFNKPTLLDPVLCFLTDKLQVFPNTCTGIAGAYYREPATLLLSTPTQVVELRNPLCLVLVQKAVQLALESITDSRFQTQAAILQGSTPA